MNKLCSPDAAALPAADRAWRAWRWPSYDWFRLVKHLGIEVPRKDVVKLLEQQRAPIAAAGRDALQQG